VKNNLIKCQTDESIKNTAFAAPGTSAHLKPSPLHLLLINGKSKRDEMVT